MRRLVLTFMLVAVAGMGSLSAQILTTISQVAPLISLPEFSNFAVGPLSNNYEKAVEADLYQMFSQRPLGEFTLQESKELSQQIAIAKAKDAALVDAAKVSLLWPGAIQLRNGDWLSGGLFAAGNVTILGMGLWATWSLLPQSFRDNPIHALTSTNTSVAMPDYAPAVGLGVGTWLAYQAWGLWAAYGGVTQTQKRIDAGQFDLGPVNVAPGGYGLVLRW